MINTIENNNAVFLNRFRIYLKERFPIFKHILLIATFTFSAIAYSRLCRNAEGFVAFQEYVVTVFMTFTLFFLLRVADEFKDQEDDALHRPYLPVPRGLISLKELKIVAIAVLAMQILVIIFLQFNLWKLYLLVMGYLFLMKKEFFIAEKLKAMPISYMVSHMMIIPLVDCYASGADWMNAGINAPLGLLFFFVVSFLNGTVLEFGRKIRSPEDEEHGVQSYTSIYGTKKAVYIWLGLLVLTGISSVLAASYAGFILAWILIFPFLVMFCALPAILFLISPNSKRAKWIENCSGIWTLCMYLFLGGLPFLIA